MGTFTRWRWAALPDCYFGLGNNTTTKASFVITRRPNGFFLNHVLGKKFPIVNGATLNERPCPLNPDDVIELAGVRMEFLAR